MQIPLERLFTDPPVTGPEMTCIRWHPDGRRFTYLLSPGEKQVALWSCDLETGEKACLLEEKALRADADDARLSEYQWLPGSDTLLLVAGGSAWLYPMDTRRLERVLTSLDDQVPPHSSPDGSRLAFLRDGNLWIKDLRTSEERALTRDGGPTVLNGKLDWVYWEELSHRKGYRAFEWSPDGERIAYLRLDQSAVPEYPLVDSRQTHAKLTLQRYPKAGDPNSIPSVHIVAAADGAALASESLPDDGAYIGPDLAWTPDGAAVAWTWLARDQRRLELRLLTAVADRPALLAEEDPFWLNRIGPPLFLPDGRFLWVSEQDGWAHLYLHAASGEPLRQLTRGEWQVEQVHGVHAGAVYFTGTTPDPRARVLYRLSLEGGEPEPLTPAEACAGTEWQEGGGWAVITLVTPNAPAQRVLLAPGGARKTRVWSPDDDWTQYEWAASEFRDVTAPDGTLLHGRLLMPHYFDPAQRYPVVVHVYGGPHAQTVRYTWEGADPLEQLLVQQGILVWRLDNRGSWGRGHAFETPVNRGMYRVELADQLAGVDYLKSLPYVDPERIGVTGWSYGGSLTLYALTRAPEVWRCGAAGAPVTDWALYDTIYTERYMGTPSQNPEGYRACSILEGVPHLKAPLLLMHGTDDDNVHLQNTLQLIEQLARHRKPYELLVQPGQKHGFQGPEARIYQHERLVEFLTRHLRPGLANPLET